MFDISPMARSRNLPVTAVHKMRYGSSQKNDIVGFTCIEKDVLTEEFEAPLRVGDFVAYSNVGSYSTVMKPPFILPANPILAYDGGCLEIARRRETVDDVFATFNFQ